MSDSKEKILHSALALFARDGYEAVSVSAIAGELGMSKGALYRHYKNKRDIFDKIVERMFQTDHESAREHGVPPETFASDPASYRGAAAPKKIKNFLMAQFQFWTTDEFTRDFRKLLTLEQYRDPEMADLYQKCLAGGPVAYLADLFREGMAEGWWKKGDPFELAIELYAPFYLLLSMSDALADKSEAGRLLAAQLERFIKKHKERKKND